MYETIAKRLPSEATCDNAKPRQFRDEPCSSLWFWLLIWASLRLAVAVIWITLLMTMTYQSFSHYWAHRASIDGFPKDLRFNIIAVILQLVEFTMIVTFVVAGMKNSVSLYRLYYCYSIVALIIYIIAMTLCFVPIYENGPCYGEMYLSYHISILIAMLAHCEFLFNYTPVLNICLDVLLICLVKKLINKYSHVEEKATCQKV
ncbi:hypothetical protein PYW08_011600 [Mythimna loreyi]|uniref:Uncharacterized protein n=1 Tax=Mythimna loreyi TaxID=667449 RepID=A0ACC2QLT7_9NEOP|nr:hypothetical protein PYW08_011600 [Mythimna loreyi]